MIRASYQTSEGEEKKSLLLASGWWGISRHFHYIPEIAAAFFWTVPALFTNPLPSLVSQTLYLPTAGLAHETTHFLISMLYFSLFYCVIDLL